MINSMGLLSKLLFVIGNINPAKDSEAQIAHMKKSLELLEKCVDNASTQ